jgi:hypothetical protein
MPKNKNGVNKSEEVRQLLKANPAIGLSASPAAIAGVVLIGFDDR